jgi:wobble nucleotide-excising tRNase
MSGYEKQVVELVTKKITLTKTLQELVENELLQDWVDRGREVNKDRKRCAFCGNPISEERWEEINAHFSKESEELKNGLTELKRNLEQAALKLDGFLESKGLIKENIYAAFLGEYEKVMGGWNAYVEQYKKAIDKLIALVDERLANIFKPIACDYEPFTQELTPILKALNALVEKNNEYGLQLDKAKEDARTKLRLDYVHQFCVDINYAEVMEKLTNEEEELKEMEGASLIRASEIGDLRKLRKQKELEKKDEGKAAQKVTELLFNHFGNGSLSLEPETIEDEVDEETGEMKPRTRFVVKRGTDYAKNLSEGEKSLISFCYFIAHMADELNGPDADKLVIYIDDPISSLDSSHIFFMYSLIETTFIKPTNFGQLFISTHNLEFLKFMKRFKLRGPKGTKTICHYVVVKLGKGTTNDYRCEIKEMPKYLRKYMTEYNFLFEQIYAIAQLEREEDQTLYGEKYTLYYNIGNNMRKFLECYLFNRFPDADDPLAEHMADLFDDHVPSEVNRIVNEYSHLVWAERGMKVMDVPEVVKAAREILKALQLKDRKHYDTLCKSVNLDETVMFS